MSSVPQVVIHQLIALCSGTLFLAIAGVYRMASRSCSGPRRRRCFDDLSESQEDVLLAEAVPEKMRTANDFCVGLLTKFCAKKNLNIDLF